MADVDPWTTEGGGAVYNSDGEDSNNNNNVDDDCYPYLDKMKATLDYHYSSYIPPDVDCPLFITWSKRCHPLLPPPPSSDGEYSSLSTTTIKTPTFTTPTTSTTTMSSPAAYLSSSAEVAVAVAVAVDNDDNDEKMYNLRGCIGTLTPKSLTIALSDFAITSAFRDTRFDPIALQEVSQLKVSVSLLVKYEECNHCLDWTVGVHGIHIQFETGGISSGSSHHRGNGRGKQQQTRKYYSGTFLPEVACEQNWNQVETIVALVRKAGYQPSTTTSGSSSSSSSGSSITTNEFMASIRCTRYQSSKCQLSYLDYATARGFDCATRQGSSSASSSGMNDVNVRMDNNETMGQRNNVRPCVNL